MSRIGDPVEVRVPVFEKGVAREEWVPATVVAETKGSIGVAFADGRREMLPLSKQFVRFPFIGDEE